MGRKQPDTDHGFLAYSMKRPLIVDLEASCRKNGINIAFHGMPSQDARVCSLAG